MKDLQMLDAIAEKQNTCITPTYSLKLDSVIRTCSLQTSRKTLTGMLVDQQMILNLQPKTQMKYTPQLSYDLFYTHTCMRGREEL